MSQQLRNTHFADVWAWKKSYLQRETNWGQSRNLPLIAATALQKYISQKASLLSTTHSGAVVTYQTTCVWKDLGQLISQRAGSSLVKLRLQSMRNLRANSWTKVLRRLDAMKVSKNITPKNAFVEVVRWRTLDLYFLEILLRTRHPRITDVSTALKFHTTKRIPKTNVIEKATSLSNLREIQ